MTTSRQLAQQAQERFTALVLEIDTDYCQNTFGVNNGTTSFCTATGAAGTECYNTYGNCQAKAAYIKGTKTWKFCNRGMQIPVGEPLRPYISNHSFTPTEIPIGGRLAARSQTTITMADETCSDVEGDPYFATRSSLAIGTFWTRFIARNYNVQNRPARVRKGYIVNPWDWTVFNNELYLVASIAGPDNNGDINIILTDATKTLDQNMLPMATTGTLSIDLKAVEETGYVVSADSTHITFDTNASNIDDYYIGFEVYITQNTSAGERRIVTAYASASYTATLSSPWAVIPDVTSIYEINALNINVGSGFGSQYADPVSTGLPQFIAIGDEIIQYTSISGDVLSWTDDTYRAQFGTTKIDHKTSDVVQQCFAPVGKSVTDVVHRLCNAAGISDTYIDLTGLGNEDTDWLGNAALITACLYKPEKASDLLNELLICLNMMAWWDAVGQLMRFKCDMPQLASTVQAITPDLTISKSMQITPQDSMRITRSFLSFAPYSATANMTQFNSFSLMDGRIDAGAEGTNEYNLVLSEQLYSRWFSAANSLFAASFVARRVSRLRDAPFKAAFSLDPYTEVHIGDLIDVTTRKKTDASGNPIATRMRVTKYLNNGNFDIEAMSTNFSRRYGFIAPNSYPDYVSATAAERNYAFIAANTELMSDGSGAYLIS